MYNPFILESCMVMLGLNCPTWSSRKYKNEDFNGRIIRLQQEINISGENISTKNFLLHFMEELSKRDNLKVFIAPKMI